MLLFASNCKISRAMALDCTFGDSSFGLIGSRYACSARVLFDGNEKISAVYGLHQSGREDDDVQGLRIESQNIPFLPTNIETFFPNIRALGFYNNSISSVSNNHLIPFLNLEYLSLHTNKIASLDSKLFAGLTSMRFVDFAYNNIKHLGHDIELPDSGSIYFNSNPCISQFATTPEQIVTLKLDLLRNCPPTISQIEDTLESRLNWLTDLKSKSLQMERRIAYLEAMIENKLGTDEAFNES